MKEGMQKLQCGSCGCELVTLYINKEQDLVAECNKCKSTTEINICTRINFDWGDKSDGILTVF